MKTNLVLTSSNKIEIVKVNDSSISGKSLDVTEEVLELAFQYLKAQFKEVTPNGRFYGQGFGAQGVLTYLPKGVKVVRINQ